jgi:hypothetical protein
MNEKKLNNNELFAKLLIDHPPEYNIGDLVQGELANARRVNSMIIGRIDCRVFNEREKIWKYSVSVDFGNVTTSFDLSKVLKKI